MDGILLTQVEVCCTHLTLTGNTDAQVQGEFPPLRLSQKHSLCANQVPAGKKGRKVLTGREFNEGTRYRGVGSPKGHPGGMIRHVRPAQWAAVTPKACRMREGGGLPRARRKPQLELRNCSEELWQGVEGCSYCPNYTQQREKNQYSDLFLLASSHLLAVQGSLVKCKSAEVSLLGHRPGQRRQKMGLERQTEKNQKYYFKN